MDAPTFKSRLVELIQKSRKAMRLYSSLGQNSLGRGAVSPESAALEKGEFAELQTNEWRVVNTELLRRLTAAIDHPNTKLLAIEICAVRDQLRSEIISCDEKFVQLRKELQAQIQSEDFIRTALIGRSLVVLKARLQATQAACHEVDEVLRKSKIKEAEGRSGDFSAVAPSSVAGTVGRGASQVVAQSQGTSSAAAQISNRNVVSSPKQAQTDPEQMEADATGTKRSMGNTPRMAKVIQLHRTTEFGAVIARKNA